LRGFKRVTSEPGSKVTVDFTAKPEDLSLIDFNMNRVVSLEHLTSWWDPVLSTPPALHSK